MRLACRSIAYASIAGAALIAAALTELGVQVVGEFASGDWPMLYRVFFILAVFIAPVIATLAISYLLYKLFRRHGWMGQGGLWISVVLVGLTPIVAGSAFFEYGAYSSRPAPSPSPYPGSVVEEVWKEIGHGHYDTRIYEYTADVSLAELEKHYQIEMPHYCANDWRFIPTQTACQDYMHCLVAVCEIPRPLVKEPQLFTIYLRSMSETQTNVQYHIRNEGFF
jgi:hypothetical protein